MESLELKAKISKIPAKSGIYFFIRNHDKLYIGKAVNLKNRLNNYLNTKDTRIQKMVEQADSIKYQTTDSEIEALIMEALLIKKHRPPFNILLKDDKHFSFVEFSRDKLARVYITHQPKYQDSIGPFTDGTSIKMVLKYLRRIFPYCTCKNLHYNYCLNYHLGNCYGFCCLKDPRDNNAVEQYRTNVKSIRDILTGKRHLATKTLEREMKSFAKNHDFDKAIQLRERISKLNQIFMNARIIDDLNLKKEITRDTHETILKLKSILKLRDIPRRIEGYDISNIQGTNATGAMVVFNDGRASNSEYRKFKIKTVHGANDTAMLNEILTRRFKHTEWPMPNLILVDGGKGQLSSASVAVPRNIPIIALTKDAKHKGNHFYISKTNNATKLTRLPEDVQSLLLSVDSECHRFAINYYRHLSRKRALGQ